MHKRIEIKRLHVRLKGIPPHRVREVLSGLGDQVLRQLAGQDGLRRASGEQRLSALHLGTLQVEAAASVGRLRTTLAGALSEALRSQAHRSGPPES